MNRHAEIPGTADSTAKPGKTFALHKGFIAYDAGLLNHTFSHTHMGCQLHFQKAVTSNRRLRASALIALGSSLRGLPEPTSHASSRPLTF